MVTSLDPGKGFRDRLFFSFFFFGQQPLVALLLLGPSFFQIILFLSTALSTGVTGISLHMQWPLTSQSHGSIQSPVL
jgi:hypothetical protein